MRQKRDVLFPSKDDLEIETPISNIFFGKYLHHKKAYFLLLLFYYGFRKNNYAFSIPIIEIQKIFNIKIKANDLQNSVDELNQYQKFLGFTLSIDDGYVDYKTLDLQAILKIFNSYQVKKVTPSEIRTFTIYAMKLYFYIKAMPIFKVTVDELRQIFGIQDVAYYNNFSKMNLKILKPSLEKINATIDVETEYLKGPRNIIEAIVFARKDL